jgi:integrase
LTKRVVDETPPGEFVWDAECKGFGLRVTKAGTRSFLFRYRADGKQRYEPLGSYPGLTVEEARRAAETLRGKRDVDHRATREAEAEERRRAKTLAELEEHYLGPYAKARALRPGTLRDARRALRLIPAAMKTKKVNAVTKPDIRRLHADARDEAGVYTANRLLAVLSRMFALAEEEGWRSELNPCRGVKKYGEEQRWRNLSESEVARLLDACDRYVGQHPTVGRNAADAIRLLLFTGARLREALNAAWAEFDLERGIWEKPSAHTKTKRLHRLEIEGPALDLVREMRERAPQGVYLFPGEPTTDHLGRPVERPRGDLKRPWKWIAGEAGLENVRLHDLRRTTASFMLSDGASLATVGKTLGHTQAATTQRYAHLSQTVQREELRRSTARMAALKGTATMADVVALPSRK